MSNYLKEVHLQKPRSSYNTACEVYLKLKRSSKERNLNVVGGSNLTKEEIEKLSYSPTVCYKLCRYILKYNNIPKEIINSFIKYKSPKALVMFMRYTNDYSQFDREEVENIIKQSPTQSCNYARFVIKGRFKLGEISILKSKKLREKYNKFLVNLKSIDKEDSEENIKLHHGRFIS